MTDRRGVLLELARAVAPDQGVTVPAAWLIELLVEGGADESDLTVPELGALFARSESTMRTRLERGEFPGAYKLGGKQWRVPRAAVATFREAQARQTRTGEATVTSLGDWRDRPPAA